MCDVSMGGVKTIYVANFDDVSELSYDSGNTQITGVTMASGKTFVQYNFKRNTASFSSTLNVDPANGTNYVSTDIVMQFSRMDTAKRLEMKALSLNDLCVIVEDVNGKKWFFGITMPVSASAGDAATGTAMTDRNGYSITLQANELEWAYEFTGEIPA